MPSGVYEHKPWPEERKARYGKKMKEVWSDPERNTNLLNSRKAESFRKKIGDSVSLLWEDPDYCKKQSDAQKQYYEEHPEAVAAISDRAKENVREKSPNWRGGISEFPYPFDFNEELKSYIRNRDDNICQLCGKTKEQEGRNLTVHHIDYIKENLNLCNLVALCKSCNGHVNKDRDWWEYYFNSRMMSKLGVELVC